jgi:uncharacterized LabA/DUF88 family protein
MGAPTGPARVWVFIDGQNVLRDARDAFHDPKTDPASFGQVYPDKLAELLVTLGIQPRVLDQVRVYTGAPANVRQPTSYRAHMKQRSVWIGAGVKVFPRTLRYPSDWPKSRAQEKGVDVALAVDLVRHGLVDKSYDVGIVVSTDTDLVPALEAVVESPDGRAWGWPRVEVFTWAPNKKQLRLSTKNLWCYRLDEAQYESVRDHTNYTL